MEEGLTKLAVIIICDDSTGYDRLFCHRSRHNDGHCM